jgi:lipopolysaccharide transport protein LptA
MKQLNNYGIWRKFPGSFNWKMSFTIAALLLGSFLMAVAPGNVDGKEGVKAQETGVDSTSEGSGQVKDDEEKGSDEKPLENVTLKVEDFERAIKEDDGEESIIRGSEAVLLKNDVYEIKNPVLITFIKTEPKEEGGESSLERVTLTAEMAEFYEKNEKVELHGSVKAIGSDFAIFTERVLYNPQDRSIASDERVHMRRFGSSYEEGSEADIDIKGKGLDVDMILHKFTVREDVHAIFWNVSEDFLSSSSAGVKDGDKGDDPGGQKVVITSEGAMVYEHGLNRVTFRDDVVVVTEDKTVKSDVFVVNMAKGKEKKNLEIKEVVAEGNARLILPEQTLSGAKMVWQSLTQTGVLTGDYAKITTPDMEIRGQKVTFYKLDDRFRVEGAGKLVWNSEDDLEAGDGGSEGPLAAGGRLTVVWDEDMAYRVRDNLAVFRGNVVAEQGDTILKCSKLQVEFGGEQKDLQKLEGEGDLWLRPEGKDGRTVTGHRLTWEQGDNTVKIFGNEEVEARVQEGENEIFGEQIDYNPSEDVFECSGAGRLILPGGTRGDGDGEPLEVHWRDSMFYSQTGKQPYAEFHGQVEAYQPGRHIVGEILQVHFDENSTPLKIIVEGNAGVRVYDEPQEVVDKEEAGEEVTGEEGSHKSSSPSGKDVFGFGEGMGENWELKSEQIIGYPEEDNIEAFGEGELTLLQDDGSGDRIAWSKAMDISFDKTEANFYGDVDARFSGTELRCAELKLDFDSARELRHVSAEGAVYFRTTGENEWVLESENASAVFAPGGILHQVIARGNVRVRDMNRRLRSEFLILFFESPKAEEGKVQLKKADAREDVSVVYTGDIELKADGDRLQWDSKDDNYRLYGSPAKLIRQGLVTGGEDIIFKRPTGDIVDHSN